MNNQLIPSAEIRKADLIAKLNIFSSKVKEARDMALSLPPTDVDKAEPMHEALRKLESLAQQAWESFTNIYFPKGAVMDLALRSIIKTNEVKLSGGSHRGADICYQNLSSGKYGHMYINSLLCWGKHFGTPAERARRARNINQHLLDMEAARVAANNKAVLNHATGASGDAPASSQLA